MFPVASNLISQVIKMKILFKILLILYFTSDCYSQAVTLFIKQINLENFFKV